MSFEVIVFHEVPTDNDASLELVQAAIGSALDLHYPMDWDNISLGLGDRFLNPSAPVFQSPQFLFQGSSPIGVMSDVGKSLINSHGIRVGVGGLPDAGRSEAEKSVDVGQGHIVGQARAKSAGARGSGGRREGNTSLRGETVEFILKARTRAGGRRWGWRRRRRGRRSTRASHISVGGRRSGDRLP
jgi:hypothetical protein